MAVIRKTIVTTLILLLAGFTGALSAQGIKKFYIQCNPDDLAYIYENYWLDYTIPVSLTFQGTSWDGLSMRIRGDSSREFPKKSLKVSFDGEPFITGESVLNFNADYLDQSYMHSTLSTRLFRTIGIMASNVEPVEIFINGEYFGLYLLTEQVDESFFIRRGIQPDGVLYKAAKDGACLGIYDNVFYHWQIKFGTDYNLQDLSGLIKSLDQWPDEDLPGFLSSRFDQNNLFGFFAMNMLLSNGSTYYHNYYLYHDITNTGKWYIIPWDLDRTFSDYGIWLNYQSSSGYWTPDNPLLERTIADQSLLAEVRSRIVQFRQAWVNPDWLYPVIDSIREVIYQSVLSDTTDNIPDETTWLNKIEADKSFIADRYSQLIWQIDHQPYNFRINRPDSWFWPGQPVPVSWKPSADPNGENITYKVSVSSSVTFDPSQTTVYEIITSTSFNLPAFDTEGRWYLAVTAGDGTSNSSGFDSYIPFFILSGVPQIVINEICYNPSDLHNTGDWVELYNSSDQPVDLSGWVFRDENDQHGFQLPDGTILGADDYLVLCKDLDAFSSFYSDTINALGNLGFGLNGGGELIRLYHPLGLLVDSLVYDNQEPWPVEPDGNGPTLELFNPHFDNAVGYHWRASEGFGTPGAQNSTYSPDGISLPGASPAITDLRFSGDRLVFRMVTNIPAPVNVSVFSTAGQMIHATSFQALSAGEWKEIILPAAPKGLYLISFESNRSRVVKKVVKSH